MSKPAKFISEGGSSNRPPLFEGDDYYYWKDKMELFLRSQDNNMWAVIEVGEYQPTVKDSFTPKPQLEWTTAESDRVLLNTKAKLFIKSALCRKEYDRIMECKTAKEMWNTLQTHHEGTSRVKETMIDIRVRKFELFEMNEEETVDQMYDFIGSLKAHEAILQEEKPLKKKMIALDSQVEEHSQNKDEGLNFQNDDEEELAFLSR
ncbi:hypothetical protein A2U01_0003357 [Trifolium medium]|uniref:Phytoalexin-deficient 4-2 protein n=1 Tax=Trifolium medium TaxID=97028 RepID=A0A392M730_9FABA|nr:hypothetical protein [Trifolium medium]